MNKEYKEFKENFDKTVSSHKCRFVLISHMSPDPDSFACVSALAYYLEKHHQISKDNISIYYEGEGSLWLKKYSCGYSIVFVSDLVKNLTSSDLIIVSDVNSYNAISSNKKFSDYSSNCFVIDHHRDSGDLYKDKLIDTNRVSCVEMVYDLFFRNNVLLDSNMVEIIMSGILGDSGSFSFVVPEKVVVFDVVSELVSKYGVSISTTKGRFFSYEPEVFPVLSELFGNFRLLDYTEYGWGVAGFTYHVDLSVPSKVQHSGWRIFAAGFLSNIEGTNWGFGFRERDESYDLSFRSNKNHHNVAKIAEYFGGGGHPAAAGASLAKSDFPRGLDSEGAINLVEEYVKNSKPEFI